MQKQKRVKDGIIAMGLVPKSQQTDEFGGYQKQWQDQKIDEFGLESISNLLNIDIEKKAQEIISKESPLQKRQIAKPVHQIQLSGQKEKSEGERVIEKKSSESHETSKNSSNEVESISNLLNIDIEKKAQEIISKESPLQKRQIAKPVHQIQLSGQKEKSEGEKVKEKKSSESHETSKNSSNEVKCYEKLKQDTTDDGMEEIKEKYKANM
eukprot:CAMPEP_0170565730 /NCGR_PEP_ID=MMETSP0211-20121228/79373_1 /TAXON_ID=311385 /ORGANISM="Pseudokeronopsis sp., Strain OXSARD2" /LENGTH=209 /DNA_ID=CAMNT_0010886687 /DNA_START=482 /DNA_END=1111 /DNA_ORIENTATION=-